MIKNVPNSLANRRLDKVSSELFPDFSRTQIKKWIIEGRIIVNGELSRPKEIVQENDEIEVNPMKKRKSHGLLRKLILRYIMNQMIILLLTSQQAWSCILDQVVMTRHWLTD